MSNSHYNWDQQEIKKLVANMSIHEAARNLGITNQMLYQFCYRKNIKFKFSDQRNQYSDHPRKEVTQNKIFDWLYRPCA